MAFKSARSKSAQQQKEAKPGKQVAKKKAGGALANWKEELRGAAKEESDRTPAGSGNKISLRKNGQFRHQGADIGEEIVVVVLDHVFTKTWYDRDFDEDNPSPPACYAVSATGKDMAPVDTSPIKQNEICENCWANEWKSDKRGRAKACKDRHVLAVAFVDDLDEDKFDVAFVTVPVTSGAAWRKYVKSLTNSEMPSWAVKTRMTMDPDAENQTLVFSLEGEVEEQFLTACRDGHRAARATLMEKPDFTGFKPAAGAKGAKTSKKSAGGGQQRSRMSR